MMEFFCFWFFSSALTLYLKQCVAVPVIQKKSPPTQQCSSNWTCEFTLQKESSSRGMWPGMFEDQRTCYVRPVRWLIMGTESPQSSLMGKSLANGCLLSWLVDTVIMFQSEPWDESGYCRATHYCTSFDVWLEKVWSDSDVRSQKIHRRIRWSLGKRWPLILLNLTGRNSEKEQKSRWRGTNWSLVPSLSPHQR